MRYLLLLSFWIAFTAITMAQGVPSRVTPAAQRLQAAEQRQAMVAASPVAGLPFKSIGPSAQSGRVVDMAVDPADPAHFYVAYASGGLWETRNNGTTFAPLFDNQAVMTIGALAVDWRNGHIWLGTGEVNSSRSSYAGLGMFHSTDGGKTWQHRGLPESHHIGRILLHPTDPNTVWVAALGHLYSPNAERGIFATTDGGRTWQHTLFVNNNAGGIELVLDKNDPKHLYAATWERTRRAWNFTESGTGTGIHESTDGGITWRNITPAGSGFPVGEGAGRLGLALGYDGKTTTLYAAIDNYNRRPDDSKPQTGLSKDALRTMTTAAFAALEEGQLRDYLRDNGFPKKYTPEKVKAMVAAGKIPPSALATYTESANSLLFDTEVVGLEIYKTTTNGKQWTKTHRDYLDDVYYSYGYYFGQIYTSPRDAKKLYVLGVPIIRSDDGGATWRGINGDNVHSDHHALWINPNQAGHLILGNDGGINISYDDGDNWIKCNHPPVGQFYYVAVDMTDTYRVYGGLQDNGVWMGEHTYTPSVEWKQDGHYPYKMIMGGDGMQVAIDPRDNATVYTGFQFGNYYRLNTDTESRKYITPMHELGESPYRWNWQTPIHLSVHNADVLYMGSNFVHRSMNRGDDFVKISPDLTHGGQKGDVPYGTLTALHESSMKFGLLYAGSDDGRVHISQDGGHTWQDISQGLPLDMWVSRVQASQYAEGRVYAVLNGYRWDNCNAMLFRSDDYGQTWDIIGRNLPNETLNVVKEDPTNQDIIYVGSDHGAYISFDRGEVFHIFHQGLPGAPVHDIVIHPRDKDIIIGTHGRSLYLASARELQAMTPSVMAAAVHLFPMEAVRRGRNWGQQSWFSDTKPSGTLPIYAAQSGTATVQWFADDVLLNSYTVDLKAGLNYVAHTYTYTKDAWPKYKQWLEKQKKADERLPDLEVADDGNYYLQAGKYKVVVKKAGVSTEQILELK